jgi:hypothetical protein
MHGPYAQLFLHIKRPLHAFCGQCHMLGLASRGAANHQPPAAFQGAQAMAQIAFIDGQRFGQVFMTTDDHAPAPLMIGQEPAHNPLLEA